MAKKRAVSVTAVAATPKAKKQRVKRKEPSRVYCFPCRMEAGKEVIEQTMFECNRYRNRLAAIERKRRDDREAINRTMSPELAEIMVPLDQLQLEHDDLDFRVKRLKHQTRSSARTEAAEMRAQMRRLKQEMLPLRARRKACLEWLRENHPELKEQRQAVSDAAKEERKRARGESKLYTGNYHQVERAVGSWGKSARYPQYRRYRGDGCIGTQIQGKPWQTIKGLSVEDAFAGKDTRLRMEYIDCPITAKSPRKPGSLRNREVWVRAHVRVGSDAKHKPLWATVVFNLSRPFPRDCVFTWAYVRRERTGTLLRWALLLTIARASFPHEDAATTGVCAVDIGWRKMDDGGVRVGYFYAPSPVDANKISPVLAPALHLHEDGCGGELRLPSRLVETARHCELVIGTRDMLFNSMRDVLADWVEARPYRPELLGDFIAAQRDNLRTVKPHRTRLLEYIRRRVEHLEGLGDHWPGAAPILPQEIRRRLCCRAGERPADVAPAAPLTLRRWQGSSRLESLYHFWSRNRFAGDHAIFAVLTAWFEQSNHLADIIFNGRRRVLLYRRDIYRNFAAFLRRNYLTVTLEDIDWRVFMRKVPESKEEQDNPTPRRWYARLASPGRLSAILRQHTASHCDVAPEFTTMDCHACGFCNHFDKEKELRHTCDGCGLEWDQDWNAAQTIYQRGRLVMG